MHAITGIWPELTAKWKVATYRNHAPLSIGGTAVAQFAGVGYIAALHHDAQDDGFSASFNLHLHKEVPMQSNCMAIPEFSVSSYSCLGRHRHSR